MPWQTEREGEGEGGERHGCGTCCHCAGFEPNVGNAACAFASKQLTVYEPLFNTRQHDLGLCGSIAGAAAAQEQSSSSRSRAAAQRVRWLMELTELELLPLGKQLWLAKSVANA